MLRRRRRTEPHGELNVIPLIDVVFFLLVFYVIASSFSRTTAVPVDRPASEHAVGAGRAALLVGVLQDGSVQLDGRIMALAALPGAVRARLAGSGAGNVVIVADRALATGRLLAVMDACRSGGAGRVEVAAERSRP